MPVPKRRKGESLESFKRRAFRHFSPEHHPEMDDATRKAAALNTVRRYGKRSKKKGK